MKIAVVGLWHLGLVYATGLAKLGHSVVGITEKFQELGRLAMNDLPMHEPGLLNRFIEVKAAGLLEITYDLSRVSDVEFVWLAVDTPVNESDSADEAPVAELAFRIIEKMKTGSTLIYSSQVPVGWGKRLDDFIHATRPDANLRLVHMPENLRLGSSLVDFDSPDRIVLGSEDEDALDIVEALFSGLQVPILKMNLASAEMTKHAINSFLAACVTFGNEIASISKRLGADENDVYLGMSSDSRIGSKAYVKPGGPIAGGTLLRDVAFLNEIANNQAIDPPVINAIKKSNDLTKLYSSELIADLYKKFRIPLVMLGVSYKEESDTVRRSFALDIARKSKEITSEVFLYDSRFEGRPNRIATAGLEFIEFSKLTEANIYVLAATEPRLPEIVQMWSHLENTIHLVDLVGATRTMSLPKNIEIYTRGKKL